MHRKEDQISQMGMFKLLKNIKINGKGSWLLRTETGEKKDVPT